MKRILLSSILFTIGCSQKYTFNSYNVPKEFQPYMSQFETEAKKYNVSYMRYLTVKFDYLPVNKLGTCTIISDGSNPTIRIKKSYWDNASEQDKTELIFHELGHCWLKLQHNDEMFANNVPKSIMNTNHFSGIIFADNYDYYVNQLFSRSE